MARKQLIADVSVNIVADASKYEPTIKRITTDNAKFNASLKETAAATDSAARSLAEKTKTVEAAMRREQSAVDKTARAHELALTKAIKLRQDHAETVKRETAFILEQEKKLAAVRDQGSVRANQYRTNIANAQSRIASSETAYTSQRKLALSERQRLDADYGAAQASINRKIEREARRHADAMVRIENKLARDHLNQPGAVNGRKRMSQTELGIQNAAFQVGDVLSMVGSGTDPLRAIGVQLPQLLGGLGVAGAVLGGLAAAAPIVIDYFGKADEAAQKAAEAAQELDEQAKGLVSSLGAAGTAADGSSLKLFDLQQKFGDNAVAVRDLLVAQRELAEFEARSALASAAAARANQIGSAKDYLTGSNLKSFVDMTPAQYRTQGDMEELARVSDTLERFEELRVSAGATRQEINQIAAALAKVDEVSASGTGLQIADAADEARQRMEEVFGETLKTDEQLRSVYEGLLNASVQGQDLAIKMGEGADETSRLADTAGSINFDGAISSAQTLNAALANAARTAASIGASSAARLVNARIDAATVGKPEERARLKAELSARNEIIADVPARLDSNGYGDRGADPSLIALQRNAGAIARIGEQAAELERLEAETRAADSKWEASLKPAKEKTGGGGRKTSAADKAERAAAKRDQKQLNELIRESGSLTDSTRTKAEQYAAEMEHIKQLAAGGLLGMSEQELDKFSGLDKAGQAKAKLENKARNAAVEARAIEDLDEKYSSLRDTAQSFEDASKSAFTSLITGAASAQDALASLAGAMASTFANNAADGLWDILSGSGGGGGSGLGSLLSSGAKFLGTPGFANGTDSAPGGLAIVGELGKELVNLPRGSEVVPASKTADLLAGAGGGGIGITITPSPLFDAHITDRTSAAAASTVKAGIADYDRNAAPLRSRAIGKNPRRIG